MSFIMQDGFHMQLGFYVKDMNQNGILHVTYGLDLLRVIKSKPHY
jgi:hypothetical protein